MLPGDVGMPTGESLTRGSRLIRITHSGGFHSPWTISTDTVRVHRQQQHGIASVTITSFGDHNVVTYLPARYPHLGELVLLAPACKEAYIDRVMTQPYINHRREISHSKALSCDTWHCEQRKRSCEHLIPITSSWPMGLELNDSGLRGQHLS
ncbi:hypothetical protein RRG08_059184 [Elysia crispata]|uniref:Uncharacterized protein n=1 Tax=Elysia crispata TaxID=231223 RepID=A0AAE1DET3_9GAST|nr:hypothetical protein RRG08_059184 [Elysia crispata]